MEPTPCRGWAAEAAGRLAGSCRAASSHANMAQPLQCLWFRWRGASLSGGHVTGCGWFSLPSPSGQEGNPTAMLEADPFCLVEMGKAGAPRAKIPAEAGMPHSWQSHCSGWSFCKAHRELLLTGCSGRRPAGPWGGRLPPLAEPAELRWILQPGLRLCSRCSKSLWLLARDPWGVAMGTSSRLPSSTTLSMPRFSCARSDRSPSRRHGCKTSWQAGSWGGGQLAPASPRDAASSEGGAPSTSLTGAAQTGRLRCSQRGRTSGGSSHASPSVAGGSCASSHGE